MNPFNPINRAIISGNVSQVKKLIDEGIDVNQDQSLIYVFNLMTRRVLLNKELIINEIIKLLIESGANPNIIDADGDTPLIKAVENNLYESCKILLELGADPNHIGSKQMTPLELSYKRNPELATLLIRYGAKDPTGQIFSYFLRAGFYYRALLLAETPNMIQRLYDMLLVDPKGVKNFIINCVRNNDLNNLEQIVQVTNSKLKDIVSSSNETLLLLSCEKTDNIDLTRYIYFKIYDEIFSTFSRRLDAEEKINESLIKYILKETSDHKIAISEAYRLCHIQQFRFLYEQLNVFEPKVKNYVFRRYLSQIEACSKLDYVLIEFISNSF